MNTHCADIPHNAWYAAATSDEVGRSPLARRLLRLFLELNRLGTAVLIATHDIGLMDQLDARRMVIENGHLEIYE